MPKYKVTVTREVEVEAPAAKFAAECAVFGAHEDFKVVGVRRLTEPFKMGDKVMVKAGSLPKVRPQHYGNRNVWGVDPAWDRRRYVSGREFTVVGRTLADRCILQSHSGERVLYYNDDQLVRSEA